MYTMAMSTCPTCGEPGIPGAVFCGSCGSRLVSDPARDDAADPFIGQTINGTYAIQAKIGSGGMGDVYRAIHNKLDSPVALKIVKPALLAHPAMVHRFEREARAASKLHHPNVVAVTDFGQSQDRVLFMVMEYVAGKSLAQVIAEDAPLSERRVVHIGAQILSALSEAHANHILHRDLKPENVMIERRRDVADSVKVLDFGIAKVLAVGASASTLTQAGLVCGTPGYMSPEQLQGGDVDVRSDLFSLGVVLYEMLTHKLPFDAQTPMEMLHKQLSEPIPPPGERRGRAVSPDLARLVLRSLSPDREERPSDADEMRAELLRAELSISDEGDAEEGLATEVLPRRDSSRSVSVPAPTPRSTPPRPESPPGRPPSQPPAARTEAVEGRRTPRPERTRTRSVVARRESPSPSASGVPKRERRSGSGTPGIASGTGATAARGTPTFEKRIQDRIAPLLGPVAPHLIKKVGHRAATLHDLCHGLAEFIPSTQDRKAFLAWCNAELGGARAPARGRPATPPSATPAVAWDPAVLDRARRDLAAYVGPLARFLVRRACARARDVHELYELLARDIPGDEDRDAFRRIAPPERGVGAE
jgi:serine/threonine protein kinase